jgi:hypothetical protein
MDQAKDEGAGDVAMAAAPGACYLPFMIKLLEDAIAKLRDLPEAAQEEAAAILLSIAAKRGEPIRLDPETRAAVRRGLAQAERGDFVPDKVLAEADERHGL